MAKVIVGLSGGVDSAVAAYILKQQGYEVVGAFMRNWDSQLNNDILGNDWSGDICPQEVDYNDAKEVARLLDIPLLRVDFIKEYWDHVFTYFLDEYKKGRTPNPDIMCNKYIKFDSFLKFAKKNGADYVATGHYATIIHKDGQSILAKAKDNNNKIVEIEKKIEDYKHRKYIALTNPLLAEQEEAEQARRRGIFGGNK